MLCLAAGALFLSVPGPARAHQTLVLAIHPYLSTPEVMARFQPLADRMAVALGQPVRVSVATTYDQHIADIGDGRADLAYLGPVAYVRLTDRYGPHSLLARQADDGKPYFRGAVIVREDSPFKKLSDLKGKRFAFGDPASTMSHVVPRVMLHDAGVGIEDLAAYDFVGGHKDVALSVLTGQYDAGGVKEDILQPYVGRGLRALAMSEAFSEHVFVAGTHMEKDLQDKVRTVLLNLHKDATGRDILKSIQPTLTEMVPAADSDYDSLRRIMETFDRITAKRFVRSPLMFADLGIQQHQK